MASPSSNEEHNQRQEQQPLVAVKEKECVHKTKTIQFLGRTTPIVLQNDNGPCPLLAICNVLLLRNNLNLSPDMTEVSQEKLLSLVAERLIDSNSNVNNKDAGYIENQQQNIADAIDLLPRLTTGIDVNLKFRRIDDFEFTRECAIFDLLDIPLYHGWIVDPQDYDTANAIGSKSYNTLTEELVALETMESENNNNLEEDCIDFAAATTATLGVPSPCLSKTKSFDDSPRLVSDHQNVRKGDLEEEAELLRVLKLSEAVKETCVSEILAADVNQGIISADSDGIMCLMGAVSVDSADKSVGHTRVDNTRDVMCNNSNSIATSETFPEEMTCSSETDQNNHLALSTYSESREPVSSSDDVTKNSGLQTPVHTEFELSLSSEKNAASMDFSQGSEKCDNQSASIANVPEPADNLGGHDAAEGSEISTTNLESDSSSGRMQNIDAPEAFTSSVDGSEPIYEGEECILDSGTTVYADREPMYEGEVVLAEQADKTPRSKDEITPQQGELIRNFLKNNASQLTFSGLFCLQDGLNERELCVFFRNNHFSTMFKYNDELYLLATDQGYLNQPDLVWEKLNEVNGDTLFMTGSFKEFKMENHSTDTWDESNAMASTADYLASIDSAAQAGLDMNSDLQLAIALQQQEFEQQQQQQQQRHNVQQPSIGSSRLITGPQTPRTGRTSTASSRPEAKSKDKCIVM